MLTRTHFVFAIFVSLILVSFLDVSGEVLILFLLFAVIGGVFVDIDSRKSKIGKRWWLRPLHWMVKHRGIFHTLLLGVILGLVIGFISKWAGIGFFVGYVSHLFLDILTIRGVELFYPISEKKVGVGLVRSGGLIEEILFVLLLLVDVGLGYRIILNQLF